MAALCFRFYFRSFIAFQLTFILFNLFPLNSSIFWVSKLIINFFTSCFSLKFYAPQSHQNRLYSKNWIPTKNKCKRRLPNAANIFACNLYANVVKCIYMDQYISSPLNNFTCILTTELMCWTLLFILKPKIISINIQSTCASAIALWVHPYTHNI